MEWDAIHYLAIINSVRVSISAPPVDTRLPERGRSAERRIFTQTTRLKTKRRGTKKKQVEVTVWAQTGAAEVCEHGRSVGQSVAPSPGREGAASRGDSPSLSGQRHYAAVSVEQWSHPPITPNSAHFLHRDIYCQRHAGQRCFTCCHPRYNLIRHKLDSRSFSEPTKKVLCSRCANTGHSRTPSTIHHQ